jgi:outer membrane immunogenic protein
VKQRVLIAVSLAASVLGSAVLGSAAYAADLKAPAYKALPVVAPVFTWTGCYAGGTVGWIRDGGSSNLTFASGVPGTLFADPTVNSTFAHSYGSGGSGVTGGIEAGCNYQTQSRLVVGVEADVNFSSRFTNSGTFGPLGPFRLDFTSTRTETVTRDLNWYSTFRGRVGFTWDRVLIYGTGGPALAEIKSTTNVAFGTDQFFLAGNIDQGAFTDMHIGWAAGVGLEWAVGSNWSVKGEYLHLDFGSINYAAACTGGTCNPFALLAWTNSMRVRDDVVRVGANYRFY